MREVGRRGHGRGVAPRDPWAVGGILLLGDLLRGRVWVRGEKSISQA